MRWLAILAVSLALPALAWAQSPEHSRLTLKNSQWDRVTVELAITTALDCDAADGRVGTQQFVLRKGASKTIDVPNTPERRLDVCWRVDQPRSPEQPNAGRWSKWSKAMLFPGADVDTGL